MVTVVAAASTTTVLCVYVRGEVGFWSRASFRLVTWRIRDLQFLNQAPSPHIPIRSGPTNPHCNFPLQPFLPHPGIHLLLLCPQTPWVYMTSDVTGKRPCLPEGPSLCCSCSCEERRQQVTINQSRRVCVCGRWAYAIRNKPVTSASACSKVLVLFRFGAFLWKSNPDRIPSWPIFCLSKEGGSRWCSLLY